MAKTTPALLATSSANDAKRSGGILSITGLDPINMSTVDSIRYIPYTAEVVQVYTIGTSAPTVVAGTVYTIKIGNVFTRIIGQQDTLHAFSYTAPSVLSGTAATDRENMYAALVTKINRYTALNVTAASLGSGTGMTITDSAGYYGPNPSMRGGASFVALTSGFTSAMLVLTTAAVYSFGVGATLLLNVPIVDPFTGNLISGSFASPSTTPVTGQRYDGWVINYKQFVGNNAIAGLQANLPQTQVVYVDNGAGTSTANAAGYLTFTKEMQRAQASLYVNDPASLVDFIDIQPVFAPLAGYGTPTATDAAVNIMKIGGNEFNTVTIGASTAIVPTWNATNGLILDMDATDTEGIEVVSSMDARVPKQFVVGQQEFTFKATINVTTVAKSFVTVGLRKKEAYNATVTSYTNIAAIGNTVASTALFRTLGNISSGTAQSTVSAVALATVTDYECTIYVDINGVVSCYVNGTLIAINSAASTPLVLVAGTIMIPFVRSVNNGGTSNPTTVLKKFIAVPGKI